VTEATRREKPPRKPRRERPAELPATPGNPSPMIRLSQRLQTLYGSIAEEPLPDDMLQLLPAERR